MRIWISERFFRLNKIEMLMFIKLEYCFVFALCFGSYTVANKVFENGSNVLWVGRQFRWFGLCVDLARILLSKWMSTLCFCFFNSCMMSPLQIESRVKLIAWLIWPNCLHHRFQMVCHGFDWHRPSSEQSRMYIDSERVAVSKRENGRRENVYQKTTIQNDTQKCIQSFECEQWRIEQLQM